MKKTPPKNHHYEVVYLFNKNQKPMAGRLFFISKIDYEQSPPELIAEIKAKIRESVLTRVAIESIKEMLVWNEKAYFRYLPPVRNNAKMQCELVLVS